MNESITTKVQKNEDGQWMIATNDGRDFGPYPTRAAARAAAPAIARSLQAPEVADVTEEPGLPAITFNEAPEDTQEHTLENLRKHRGEIALRNSLIRKAREQKIRRADIAEAAGVSANYLQHILNPQERRPSLTKFQQGYQEALADLAAVMAHPDGGVLSSVEEWIQANRVEVSA